MTSSSSGESLVDLLAERFLEQLRCGESPSIDDYVAQHPELEDELRDVLPTLQFLEDFKPRDRDRDERVAESCSAVVPSKPLEQVGEYRILKEIGRGGMGVVYEAEQVSLGRHVALKVLPKRSIHDDVAIERFQREARAAAQLQHPNIVPIFDIGSESDVSYYAMQYVRGRSLSEIQEDVRRLRGESAPHASREARGPVSDDDRVDTSTMGGRHYWRSVAKIGVQVCRALAYAHGRGVVHRDVKPSNLLLDDDGTVWVTDFGLAKTAGDDLTVTGDIVGTLRFMSPERFKGQCDERADVFGVGATLYELLTLEPAFHSPDRLHLIERISREDPRNPRSIDPGVPVDLETIVLKALEKDPRRRYQKAEELGADLTRFLSHQPIRARRTSAVGRALRWARRNRALAITATVLVSLLLVVAVSSIVVAVHMRELADAANEGRTTIERQLYRSQLLGAADAIADGRLELARRLLDEAPEGLRGWEWQHFQSRLDRSVDSGLPAGLRIHEVQVNDSGNRALLRILRADNSLLFRVVELPSRQTVFELPCDPQVQTAALYRDGAQVVTLGAELCVWDIASRTVSHREPNDSKYFVDLQGGGYLLGKATHLERRDSAHQVSGRVEEPTWWVAQHPNRRHLVVVFERRVTVFDAGSLRELPGSVELPECGYLQMGALSGDGSRLAVTSGAGRLYLFRIDNGVLVRDRDLTGYLGSPSSVVFSQDSKQVVLGTNIGRLHVWDVDSGEPRRPFLGHRAPVVSLVVAPDSGALISCDSAGQHYGWAFGTGSLEVLRGHTSFVYPVGFDRSGACIVSAGWDGFGNQPGSLRWWDARSGDAVTARLPAGEYVTDFACLADQAVAVAVHTQTHGRGVVVYDPFTAQERLVFDGHGGDHVLRTDAHPDGEHVLSLGYYELAILWHARTGEIVWQLPLGAAGRGASAACFAADGATLVLTDTQTSIRVVDAATGAVRRSWLAHADAITDLAFTPDGDVVASASHDDTVALWDLDGNLRHRLSGHGIDVLCVAVSPDGQRLASGGRDGSVLLWDIEQGQLLARLLGHRDYVYDAAWSPDGQCLVTSSGDGTVRLWTHERLAERVEARRQRRRIVDRMAPELLRQLRNGVPARTIDEGCQNDPKLSPREREVARQILFANAPGK